MVKFSRVRVVPRNDGSGKNKRISVEYNALLKQEADDQGLEYLHWSEFSVNKTAPYVLTDDGYVGKFETLKAYNEKKKYQGRSMVYLRTELGNVNCSASTKEPFLFEERLANGRWAWMSAKTLERRNIRRARVREAIIVYIAMLFRGREHKIDWYLLAKIMGLTIKDPNKIRWRQTVQRFWAKKGGREILHKELAHTLNTVEGGPAYIVETIKKIISIDENKKDTAGMRKTLKMLMDINMMGPEAHIALNSGSIPDGGDIGEGRVLDAIEGELVDDKKDKEEKVKLGTAEHASNWPLGSEQEQAK